MGAPALQTASAPPPVGGNCTTRGSDTPATRRRRASCSAKPPSQPARSAPRRLQERRRAAWRKKTRPTPPLQWHFREIVRPARVKTPNLGHFERAGRIFSRFHDLTATQGELFRACRRRPSRALPISDLAPLVWRGRRVREDSRRRAKSHISDPAQLVWRVLEGPAAVPVDNGARPRYPQTTATPSPSKFRMQFPHDTNRCTLKNRRISTIRFQHLKYT